MTRVRVDLNISLDGFATTTDQTPENPFGEDWGRLTAAYTATRTFHERVFHDTSGAGTTGVDEKYAAHYFENIGAEIMGAGMFGAPREPRRPQLAWVVGRGAAVPRSGVRADPHPATVDRVRQRHELPFPVGRAGRGAAHGGGCCGWTRRARRRRADHGARVSH